MSKFHAHGCTVEFGSVEIGDLTSISLPDQSKGDVQTTTNESDGDHEYLPGLREGGTVTLEALLDVDDTGQDALRTNYDADGVTAICFIALPSRATSGTSATYRFEAYVNALGGDLPQDSDDPGTFSATLKVAGPVTKVMVP